MKTLSIAAATVLLLAGCGAGEEPDEPTVTPGVTIEDDGTQVIEMRESEDYRFVPDDPVVTTGKIRIDMTNTSTTTTHSLAFKPGGPQEEIPFINPGEMKSISFSIANPGEYQFFCTFHEQLGQRGILTVEPA